MAIALTDHEKRFTHDALFQTPFHELTSSQKHAPQTWLDFQRYRQHAGPIDEASAKRGVLAFEGSTDEEGVQYFSTNPQDNDLRAAGLYEDIADFEEYPWAYPEHPDFKNWWGGGGGGSSQVAEKAPEKSRSVFDALETPDFSTKQRDDVLLGGSGSDDLTSFIPQQPAKIDKSSSVSAVDQLRNANADLQSVVGNQDLSSFVNRVLSSANRGLSGSAGFVGGPAIEALRAGTFQAPQFFQAPQQAPQASTGTESKIENILVDVTSEQDPLEQIIEQTPDFELVTDVDGAADDVLLGGSGDDSFDQSGGAFSEGESPPSGISRSDEDAFILAEGGFNVFGNFAYPNLIDFEEPFTGTNVKVTKAAALSGLGKGFGKGLAAGAGWGLPGKAAVGALIDVLSGKNPEDVAKGLTFDTAGALLAGPMGPIAVPFAAGLETAYDIASSPYSGFGFGHFGSGFLSNLTSGALGTSVKDQGRQQEQFEENIEDHFTYTGSKEQTEPPLGWGFIGRHEEDWELDQFGRKNIPIRDLENQIKEARWDEKADRFYSRIKGHQPKPVEAVAETAPTSPNTTITSGNFGVFGLDDGNWFESPPNWAVASPFGEGPAGGNWGDDPLGGDEGLF